MPLPEHESIQLRERSQLIRDTMQRFMCTGLGTLVPLGVDAWRERSNTTPEQLARGWCDVTQGRHLVYCPDIIAAATFALPMVDDILSVSGYLELVRLTWEVQIGCIIEHFGQDGPSRATIIASAMDVLATIPQAVETRALIELQALDGLLDDPDAAPDADDGDDWARDLGLI